MARSPVLNVMVQAVMKAGRSMRRDFGEVEQLQVSAKGPGDFVTAADRKAEDMLRTELQRVRPGYSLVMEESGVIEGTDPDHRWIVDPLDGTTNFLHGIPIFAISVALERAGQLVAGVVFNPITDELFTAERGGGAYLNDHRLRVAARRDIVEAVIGCGVPHLGRPKHDLFREELSRVQGRVSGVRRFGAASLDLAYVAAGRLDGFWERDLKSWDIAAGILLVKEAGGFVTDATGGDAMLKNGSVVCGNEHIHPELLKLVKG
ncbi:myo-inositol-1(or 4)-monophosphatase [Methylopila capsulata]|uniref:Inositol-1-monophosphatase n=1 Tax=Methylopila capsulata TaxID=61654 RepID=A0A9W6MT06_9HYPH|nr:inositol monophosphatase family protein [Methylopila capsulata]MBM7852549.1 myo-inositol-1(or 4)-monophosphatase [Methylopila capsulata]GLK56757.1 inositol monophosphatase [Methylopila capsulata]